MRSFIIIAHYFNSVSTILNRMRRRWEIIVDSRFPRAHKRGSDIGVATAYIYDININHEDFTVAVFSRRMLTHVTALHDVSYEIITATDCKRFKYRRLRQSLRIRSAAVEFRGSLLPRRASSLWEPYRRDHVLHVVDDNNIQRAYHNSGWV